MIAKNCILFVIVCILRRSVTASDETTSLDDTGPDTGDNFLNFRVELFT